MKTPGIQSVTKLFQYGFNTDFHNIKRCIDINIPLPYKNIIEFTVLKENSAASFLLILQSSVNSSHIRTSSNSASTLPLRLKLIVLSEYSRYSHQELCMYN